MSLLSLFPIFRCVSTVFRVTKPLIFLSRFCHFCHTHLRESGRHTCLLTSGAQGSAARRRNRQKRPRLSASFTMPAHNAKSPRLWRVCPEGAGEVSPPFIFHFHITENRNVRATSSVMRSGVPASESSSAQKSVQQHDSADFVFRDKTCDKTCDRIFYGRMVIFRCVSTVFRQRDKMTEKSLYSLP